MERPLEYIAKQGGWSETSNLGCFFIWSTDCVEETDFGQLIISLLMRLGTHPDAIRE